MKALEVERLTKVYPKFTLDGVSFSVEEGRIAGLIGRNGAGKSTTLKGILGMISATGAVKVFGRDRADGEREVKECVGYVGGGFRHYPAKRLSSIAKTVSRFYPRWNDAVYRKYLAEFSLDETKKIRELSEGMKVKFSLLLALSSGAKLLILDEPTSGLDPLSREEFCDVILSLTEQEGVSVLFSTHITSDLEKIADDVIYLSEGKILFNEPLNDLTNRFALARFSEEDAARRAGAIGIKRIKEGYEGLLPFGSRSEQTQKATLDDIIVHFEYAKRRAEC